LVLVARRESQLNQLIEAHINLQVSGFLTSSRPPSKRAKALFVFGISPLSGFIAAGTTTLYSHSDQKLSDSL
jgi:hypothetical protein